ncbi:MAG TPA: hypothetical protein VMI74_12015 [Burkholderiales bacterium]|nr:hypothetical protein [Burkholderiales bacterium]
MDRAGYHIRLVAFSAVGMLALLAMFNFVVDPYGNFDVPRISGVNERPLGFNRQPLLAKSLAVTRIRPESIILGNSRPESAYAPRYSGFFESPGYNLAVGGAHLGQVRRYFLEALATGRLRQVLLTTDISMFDPSQETSQHIPDVFMLTDESGRPTDARRKWLRLAFVLLSGPASADSWWSLRHQRDPVVDYSSAGVREESANDRQVEREGGHRSASWRTESAFLAQSLRDVGTPGFPRAYDAMLAQLGDIVALSARHGVRLDIVIDPIHARYSYVYAAAGLWPLYRKWKRDLVELVARSHYPVGLWDFSGVSQCSSEPLPPEGNTTTRMRWYWESGHFRPRLGKLVLDMVYGGRSANQCPGLGGRLEPGTLDAALAAQDSALDRWIESHPVDVAEIDALAKRYGRDLAPANSFTKSEAMRSGKK